MKKNFIKFLWNVFYILIFIYIYVVREFLFVSYRIWSKKLANYWYKINEKENDVNLIKCLIGLKND